MANNSSTVESPDVRCQDIETAALEQTNMQQQQQWQQEKTAQAAEVMAVETAKEIIADPLAMFGKMPVEHGTVHSLLAIVVKTMTLALLFSVVYCMLKPTCKAGEECVHPGLPGGIVFDLLLVIVGGVLGGGLVARFGLPPLLGQLIMGFFLKNIMQLNGLSTGLNSMLRNVALAIIMLRAGLGLDFAMLRKSSVSVLFLATGPCIGEAMVIAICAHIIFPGMSWPFCLMLGFCIADVSPAVTTPILLDLQIQKRGTKKGCPSILLAAGSVNSVMAIVFYKVSEEFAWTDAISPESIVSIVVVKFFLQVFGIGGGAGWVMGKIIRLCWGWTDNTNTRFAILFLTAMLTLFGFKQIGMSGGGTLAVLTMGTTIHNSSSGQEFAHMEKHVTDILQQAWSNCGSLLLFTLLGASLDASKLNPQLVGTGAMLVALGLVGRSIVLYFTLFLFPQWGVKEKLFSMVSWCPKATVQAALATAALDYITLQIESGMLVKTDPVVVQQLQNARVILTTAILSIIMTAPLFAVLMLKLAPHLLDDDRDEEDGPSEGDVSSSAGDASDQSLCMSSGGDVSTSVGDASYQDLEMSSGHIAVDVVHSGVAGLGVAELMQ